MNNPNEDSPKFPPARPEITAEIVALDCLLADLILKCQGNARELDNLFGVLDNHLADCETGRDNLLGIESDRSLTMTDLPIDEQKIIVGLGLFSTFLLDIIFEKTRLDREFVGIALSRLVNEALAEIPKNEISKTLDRYIRDYMESVDKPHKECLRRMQKDNN
jgi:hypothetical protein